MEMAMAMGIETVTGLLESAVQLGIYALSRI